MSRGREPGKRAWGTDFQAEGTADAKALRLIGWGRSGASKERVLGGTIGKTLSFFISGFTYQGNPLDDLTQEREMV